MASWTTRRHSRDDPREDVDVCVVVVECQLITAAELAAARARVCRIVVCCPLCWKWSNSHTATSSTPTPLTPCSRRPSSVYCVPRSSSSSRETAESDCDTGRWWSAGMNSGAVLYSTSALGVSKSLEIFFVIQTCFFVMKTMYNHYFFISNSQPNIILNNNGRGRPPTMGLSPAPLEPRLHKLEAWSGNCWWRPWQLDTNAVHFNVTVCAAERKRAVHNSHGYMRSVNDLNTSDLQLTSCVFTRPHVTGQSLEL